MKTGIITIGDEILMGQITDTNSAYISRKLTDCGYEICEMSSIGDTDAEIRACLDRMLQFCSFIVITGGLGPTKDDITKHTLCSYFKDDLVFNSEIYSHIEQLFYGKGGLKMSGLNKAQAYLPNKAKVLKNFKGTASGMWFEREDTYGLKVVVSLPGVPFEMEHIMESAVLPTLKERFPDHNVNYKVVITYDIAESLLAEQLAVFEDILPPHVKLAYLPSPGLVKLRLTQYGGEIKTLSDLFIQLQEELKKSKIFSTVYSEAEATLEKMLGLELLKRKLSLATAESCTGGYIAHRITSIPGASEYYKGSIVSYSNEVKENVLGVSKSTLQIHGAVSEETVKAMALGAQKLFKCDCIIATSGIAGPDGGSEEKPVGTVWVAISTPISCMAKCFHFSFSRERNIEKSGLKALQWLYEELLLLK